MTNQDIQIFLFFLVQNTKKISVGLKLSKFANLTSEVDCPIYIPTACAVNGTKLFFFTSFLRFSILSFNEFIIMIILYINSYIK